MIPIVQMYLEVRRRHAGAGLVQHALVRTVKAFNSRYPVKHKVGRDLLAWLGQVYHRVCVLVKGHVLHDDLP